MGESQMDNFFYYIAVRGKDQNTAGVKAPKDIETLLGKRGYKKIEFRAPSKREWHFLADIEKKCGNLINWGSILFEIKRGALVFVQYPYGTGRIALKSIPLIKKLKNAKFVFLLHDINSLRGYNETPFGPSEQVLRHADFIICHNDKMKTYLLRHGLSEKCIYTLKVFDYLCDKELQIQKCKNTIALAGNLSTCKSPYIGKLFEMKKSFHLNVYGPNYIGDSNYINTKYCGQYGPDDIPSKICGNWGLVWDGDSIESCSGKTGNYLKYNNPHKLSLYIASGIPVILWNQAALADYVREKNIGILVSSLPEIDERIAHVTDEEYAEMAKNVRAEAYNLRNGYYLNAVMDLIEKHL